jgi:hypothetical protein
LAEQAIAACLANMPLQSPVGSADANAVEAKSRLFLQYFTFFMNVTNRCRIDPDGASGSADTSLPLSTTTSHVARASEPVVQFAGADDAAGLTTAGALQNAGAGQKESSSAAASAASQKRRDEMPRATSVQRKSCVCRMLFFVYFFIDS